MILRDYFLEQLKSLNNVEIQYGISFSFWFKVPLLWLSVSFSVGFMLLSEEELKASIKKVLVIAFSALIALVLMRIFAYFINPNVTTNNGELLTVNY